MQKIRIGRRLIIAGFFLLSLIPFFWLTDYCSSREHVNNKTAIERKETTKTGEYKTNNNFAFGGFTFHPNSTYQEKSTEQAIQTNEEPSGWWNDFWCGIKISDILLAYFTLMLAIFTWRLWISTEKLWAIGRSEFNATHRPKLILRYAYTPSVVKGEIIKVTANITNIGNSPATIIASRLKLELFDAYKSIAIPLAITGAPSEANDILYKSRFTQLVGSENTPIFIAQGASHDFVYPINGDLEWNEKTMADYIRPAIGLFFPVKLFMKIMEKYGEEWLGGDGIKEAADILSV